MISWLIIFDVAILPSLPSNKWLHYGILACFTCHRFSFIAGEFWPIWAFWSLRGVQVKLELVVHNKKRNNSKSSPYRLWRLRLRSDAGSPERSDQQLRAHHQKAWTSRRGKKNEPPFHLDTLTENYIPSTHLQSAPPSQRPGRLHFVPIYQMCAESYFARKIEEKIQGRASGCECVNDRPNTNIVNPIPGQTAAVQTDNFFYGKELLFSEFHGFTAAAKACMLGELL